MRGALAFLLVVACGCKKPHATPAGPAELARDALPAGAQVYALGGTSATDVWAVGAGVYHYDGASWSDATPAELRNVALNALAVVAKGDVWVAGASGHVAHFDGAKWSVETRGTTSFTGVAAWPGEAWVSDGQNYFRRVSGDAGPDWIAERSLVGAQLLWTQRENDVWGFPGTKPEHWNGTRWSQPTSFAPAVMRAASGTPNDLWMVGWEGTVRDGKGAARHFDGRAWTTPNLPAGTPLLRAVSAPKHDEAYAVGNDGTALAWNGGAWRALVTGTEETLEAVFAPGGGVVFAAGREPYVLHKR